MSWCEVCQSYECIFNLPRPPRPEPLTATQRMRLVNPKKRFWWDRYLTLYKRLRVR